MCGRRRKFASCRASAAASRSSTQRLADLAELPPKPQATQLTAVSSGKILVEGLKRAGRDVSREKLIEALEGLYAFRTGFTPPVTFGPNRRVGALGAYIVSLDLERKRFVPAGGWIDLNSDVSPYE